MHEAAGAMTIYVACYDVNDDVECGDAMVTSHLHRTLADPTKRQGIYQSPRGSQDI